MSDSKKAYDIVVHDDASQMLLNHVRFLANVSIPAARRLRASLHKGLSSLKSMPHRCPVFSTRRTADTYRQLIIGRYLVVFSIDENKETVNIRYILDSRQDNDI